MTREDAIKIFTECIEKNDRMTFCINDNSPLYNACDFAISDMKRVEELEAENARLKEGIDKIKAEIDTLSDSRLDGNTVTIYSWKGMKRRVFEIIDKYKAESGNKE